MTVSRLFAHYRELLSQPAFLRSFVLSAILFTASITANFYAGVYATHRSSNFVNDIILSNIPVWQVDELFVWGAIAFIALVTVLCLVRPNTIPFTLLSLAFFYFVRAGFVTLTHIGPYPDHAILTQGMLVERFFGADDLFFSGHTGAPFLIALVYWRHAFFRYLFIAWAIFMGVVVLLGHLHYTIDVLSAFFITYTIFHIVEWLFPRERRLFYEEEGRAP